MQSDNKYFDFIKRLTIKYENNKLINDQNLILSGGQDQDSNVTLYKKIGVYKNNKVYRIRIRNTKITPWLDWIEQGTKTYEGRLNRGIFRNLKIYDIIIFYDQEGKEVKTLITSLKYYPDFVAAFKELGSNLVPIKGITENEVQNLYWQYFSQDEIEKNHVVAIGVELLKNNQS